MMKTYSIHQVPARRACILGRQYAFLHTCSRTCRLDVRNTACNASSSGQHDRPNLHAHPWTNARTYDKGSLCMWFMVCAVCTSVLYSWLLTKVTDGHNRHTRNCLCIVTSTP